MKIWKIAALGSVALGMFYLGSEIDSRKRHDDEWKRFGEIMAVTADQNFREERGDVANGLGSDSKYYINKNGYGIRMPRSNEQEEHFKEYGVNCVSIKTKEGDIMPVIAYTLYKDSSEWFNFKFLNPELLHYGPQTPLPKGLEIRTYMLPSQMLQYMADFPEREVCVVDENKQGD